MQLFSGEVKFKAYPPEDKGYGPSINVPISVEGAGDTRIFVKTTSIDYAYASQLKGGDKVTLVKDDKGKFKFVLPAFVQQAPAQTLTAPVPPNPLTDPAGPAPRQQAPIQQVAQAVAQAGQQALAMRIKTYLAIYQTLRENLPLVDDAVLVQAANAIFNKEL